MFENKLFFFYGDNIDFDTNVLSNCQSNVNMNSIKPGNTIVTRRLNWFLPCLMEVEGEDEDDYSWTLEEIQEWTDEGAFIFAADGNVN